MLSSSQSRLRQVRMAVDATFFDTKSGNNIHQVVHYALPRTLSTLQGITFHYINAMYPEQSASWSTMVSHVVGEPSSKVASQISEPAMALKSA